MKRKFCLLVYILILSGQAVAKNQVNVYSFRKPEIISPLISAYETNSGINVNLVYGKPKALLKKLANEKGDNQADVILTSELSQLNQKQDILQPIKLTKKDHDNRLIDEQSLWVALSLRIRALFTKRDKSNVDIVNFHQLNDPNMYGTFCNRDFNHSYNQQLKSALLAIGNEQDTKWLENPNKLLRKRPSGGDRDQLRALYKGQCQYAFSNHYYFAMLKNSNVPFDREVAEHLNMHFIKTSSGQTPVSATAAAISRYAPNTANAQSFVNFLLSEQAQNIIAKQLNEFAINSQVRKKQMMNQPELSLALESVKGAL